MRMLKNSATVNAIEKEVVRMRKNSFISVCFSGLNLIVGSSRIETYFKGYGGSAGSGCNVL